ncbi:GNAT family N-acetyltransferase [Geodermatophilus sp. SYSU D01036]
MTPAPRDVWTSVLAEFPGATIYQTPEWFDAVAAASGSTDVSRLYELEDGRRLVLPLLRRTPVPGLRFDESYPSSYGSGGLLASGGLRETDVSLVLTDLLDGDAAVCRVKGNHDTFGAWEAGRVPGVTSVPRQVEVLDLDGDFSTVWERRFSSAARRAVRKAERSGLDVECDTTGRLVPDFYRLYLQWTERRAGESGVPRRVAVLLARRREPLEKFRAVAAIPGDGCRVWVARHAGEAIASIVTLVHGEHAVFWRGYSSKAAAGPTGANNLLQRLAIEDACRAGCRFYSMGESGGVESLVRFKRSFGATARTAVEMRVERLPVGRLQALRDGVQNRAAEVLATFRRIRNGT